MKNKIQIVEPDPYQQGYVAAIEGRSAFSNPYDLHTDMDRNCDWHDGYIQARNDQHAEQCRKEKWADRRRYLKDRLIQCLYSMAFVAVCYIIGTSVRYLLR